MNEYQTSDYCRVCRESPDSGSHIFDHEYQPPIRGLPVWNLGCVEAVMRGERRIIGLDRVPYSVAPHAYTGGPVLRGPWGSIVGLPKGCEQLPSQFEDQWAEFETRRKQLIAAYIHGHLVGARLACERLGACIGYETLGYCQRCGGTYGP